MWRSLNLQHFQNLLCFCYSRQNLQSSDIFGVLMFVAIFLAQKLGMTRTFKEKLGLGEKKLGKTRIFLLLGSLYNNIVMYSPFIPLLQSRVILL